MALLHEGATRSLNFLYLQVVALVDGNTQGEHVVHHNEPQPLCVQLHFDAQQESRKQRLLVLTEVKNDKRERREFDNVTVKAS